MAPLFPSDLIRLQRERIRTYEALARLDPGQGSTELRRRLLELSGAPASPPHRAAPGRSLAARTELLRRARAGNWGAAA